MRKEDIRNELYKQYETDGIKYIKDSKGYFVCASGDILRLAGIYTKQPYWKKIKPTIRKDGYCIATIAYRHIYIGKDINGRKYFREGQKSMMIHRLVAEAFLGKCPDGVEVDHIDGHRWHNSLNNLDYITRGENKNRHHGKFDFEAEKKLFELYTSGDIRIIPPERSAI